MWTVVPLICSNIFMTFAWYGHLKFSPGHSHPLWLIILFSWSIALVEYCFAVPANCIGEASGITTAQLKIIQEIVTLIVFAGFSIWFLKEKIGWNNAAAFVCMVGAAFFVFSPIAKKPAADRATPSSQTAMAPAAQSHT